MAPPAQNGALEDKLRMLANRPRKFRRSWLGIGFGTLILSTPLAAAFSEHLLPEGGQMFLWLVLIAMLVFVWMFGKQQSAENVCRRLVKELMQMPDTGCVSVSAIGPLLELSMDGGVSGDFLNAPLMLLESLLRSVRANDSVVLTDRQRQLLHTLVRQGTVDFLYAGDMNALLLFSQVRPAAIRALHYLGNRSSLSVLERFARETEDATLRQSALQTLEQLRERLQYGPSEMLRASIAPTRPDTLLRPVATDCSQNHDPEQLLRASTGGVRD